MTNPFVPRDLLLYQSIGELDCTPALDVAACTVKAPDESSDGYRSAIWLLPLKGGAPYRFTSGSGNDSYPRWCPDGSLLAFVSSRGDGNPQIHLIRRDGGEAATLSRMKQGVVSMWWAPDGKRFAATGPINVDPSARGERSDPPQGKTPHVVWRLPYKSDGLGYTLDREIHLFTIDAQTGESTQLTDGPFDVRSAAWSPDGRRIAYTRTRTGREAHRTDVWIMDDDGKNARRVTSEIAMTMFPVWSPDGRWIVFSGSEKEGDSQTRLWRIDMQDESVAPLGDESIEVQSGDAVHWAKDSSRVVLILVRRGLQEIASIGVPDGKLDVLVTGERHVVKLAVTADRLVYAAAGIGDPVEVYACNWDGSNETRLSDFNSWWHDRAPPRASIQRFQVPDGDGDVEMIDGWLMLPPGGGEGPFPLLIDAHGGPQAVAWVEFHKHVYRHVLCSRGWAVLALNPVGSSSYGPGFARRLRNRWGELDLDQQLAAIERLRKDGIADERLAITGKSYGGYLAAWAITKTDIFKAAVVSAPVSNIESHFGTSDSGYYVTPYAMCGEPFVNRQSARELCPMNEMDKATTPTLILQGTDDQRCPVGQSEEIYVTLMRSGNTPVEMVLYPGGDHHMAEQGTPSFRVDYVTRLVDWVDRYTNRVEDDRGTDDDKPTKSSAG